MMAKALENCQTGYMIMTCIMIWEILIKELTLLGHHLEVKNAHIHDGVALDAFLPIVVSGNN